MPVLIFSLDLKTLGWNALYKLSQNLSLSDLMFLGKNALFFDVLEENNLVVQKTLII